MEQTGQTRFMRFGAVLDDPLESVDDPPSCSVAAVRTIFP